MLHILDLTPKGQEFCLDETFHRPVGISFHKREGYLLTERVLRAPAANVYVENGVVHFSVVIGFDVAACRRRCKWM